MDPLGDKEPELFVGDLDSRGSARGKGHGTDNRHFTCPSSVACDAEGRVYVADHFNDRIQVYTPGGTHLKTIPVERPTIVRISQRNGHIYVLSWLVESGYFHKRPRAPFKYRLYHLGPFEAPQPIAQYKLERGRYKSYLTPRAMMAVDGYTDPPTIWISREANRQAPREDQNIMLFQEENGRLVLKRDFAQEAGKVIPQLRPPYHSKQRLRFNPADGCLYVAEDKPLVVMSWTFEELLRVDPGNGKVDRVKLPMSAEDYVIDASGFVYLSTGAYVARFDSRTWSEVPFDYGEQEDGLSSQGVTRHDTKSATTLPVHPGVKGDPAHLGGMGLSILRDLAMSCKNPVRMELRTDVKHAGEGSKRYVPKLYPGRRRGYEMHVWDKYGKLKHEDAFPGVMNSYGVHPDKAGNLYVLMAANRLVRGRPYLNGNATTLVKVRPGSTRVISPKAREVPLSKATRPGRLPDITSWALGKAWVEDADWLYGGGGLGGKHCSPNGCECAANCEFALDYFARSFVPENDTYSVVVLDTSGNLILRIGRYGNVDDGMPLVKRDGPPDPHSIGGDEVALFDVRYVATDTDRRLFVADVCNTRVLSVKLDYHKSASVPLKGIPDGAPAKH